VTPEIEDIQARARRWLRVYGDTTVSQTQPYEIIRDLLAAVETRQAATLSHEDATRLIPLLESARAEVDVAVEIETAPQPDDPMAVMDAYDWAGRMLARCAAIIAEPPR
jgi:hypothetical protein